MKGIKHITTDESKKMVKLLSSLGVTYEDIALKLEINSDCLVKHYKKELADGRIDANAQIAKGLFEQARAGNVQASIFWLKTRARWRETTHVDITTKSLPVSIHEFV